MNPIEFKTRATQRKIDLQQIQRQQNKRAREISKIIFPCSRPLRKQEETS